MKLGSPSKHIKSSSNFINVNNPVRDNVEYEQYMQKRIRLKFKWEEKPVYYH